MARDRPWKIDWPGGKIIVHASTQAEAAAKVLEYLKATNPFRVEAIQEEYVEKEIGSPSA
jgi:hypothetical protein